jgi:signal transduction histidine kinase
MRLLKALNLVFIAGVYFGLAVISLKFSFHSSNASPVWPPSGFAFAILLLRNQKIAYGIFFGAFSANLYVFLNNGTCALPTAIIVSMLIAAGNTLEALVGYFLLQKMMGHVNTDRLFTHVQPVYKFVLAALIMCVASCTIGSISILVGGIIPASEFMLVWFTWWAGDVSGILLFTPFIIVLAGAIRKSEDLNPAKWPETAILIAAVVMISGIVFRNWFQPDYVFSRAFIITPFLIWAAIRLDQRIVIGLLLFSALMALSGTLVGKGPFANTSLNQSLLTVEVFVSINSVMILLLQAAVIERRKHERYLNAARENLESIVLERTKELHSKNQQLEKRNNELVMFSYSASHDLREPLRKIEFFSNRILEGEPQCSEQERELAKRIKATTQRMNQLVENLLSYSLLEGQEQLFKQTDLNFVLTEVKNNLAKEIEETGAIIESEYLPVVNGVRSQLVQLFMKILDNSLKFRRSEVAPHVTIRSELANEVVCDGDGTGGRSYFHLSIRDNGIGFEKEYAGKIFEILQKLHGQNEYEGSGIGLAICKKVMENHGGFICADAEPGMGTVIHIYFPAGNVNENLAKKEKANQYS